MSTNHWQQRYSMFFLLIVLGSSALIMFKSLKGGIAGFEENFPGKQRLIATFNRLRYSVGDKVFAQVLVGKEGWLEFTSDGNLDDYQNAHVFPEQLESIHQKLDLLNEELAARGITLFVVIAPNKATIYEDKVSEKIEKINKQSRLDVFLELMKRTNSPYVIDLRPPLTQARQDHQLYYRTDSHWNSLGAYLAYREVMNAVSQAHPDLQPYELDQFSWKETDPQTADLPKLMGVGSIREPRNELRPKFNSMSSFENFHSQSTVSMSWATNGQEKTLLMYHDSFGVGLQPFLQHHFKQATYIRNGPETSLSDMSWIDRVNPDVVMIEIVERSLPNLDALLSNP